MKILFVGVLDISWSTNRAMQRELEKLGHEVISFNYRTIESGHVSKRWYSDTKIDIWLDKAASYLRRDSWIPFRLGWYFHRKGRDKMNHLLIETVRKGNFDLIFMSKADSVDYRLIEKISQHAPTWYFFMDPMDQVVRMNAGAYAKRATWTSATFSDVTEYFRKTGAQAFWIPQGVNTELFTSESVEKSWDVVFVGSRTPDRTAYIKFLHRSGINVVCYGEGWENEPIFHEQLVDVYRKSRIVLNFRRSGTGFSIRVFQVLGTGTFLLSEYCPDLETFFERGAHLDWFRDKKEMLDKIRRYLADEEEREHIARAGCRFVHDKHSWHCVMRRIVNIMNEQRERR